ACQLADALCEAAQWRDRRTPTWATQYPPDNHISSRSISTGGAGILLALAELAAEFGDKHYFDALKEGATWLANAPPLPGEPLAGLYTGEAGVAVAVLRVGQVLHNQDFLDHSSQLLGYVAQRGYGPPHNIP